MSDYRNVTLKIDGDTYQVCFDASGEAVTVSKRRWGARTVRFLAPTGRVGLAAVKAARARLAPPLPITR